MLLRILFEQAVAVDRQPGSLTTQPVSEALPLLVTRPDGATSSKASKGAGVVLWEATWWRLRKGGFGAGRDTGGRWRRWSNGMS